MKKKLKEIHGKNFFEVKQTKPKIISEKENVRQLFFRVSYNPRWTVRREQTVIKAG